MKYLSLLIALASFGNCKSHQEMKAANQPENATKLVGLQMFPCRGFCPVYTITIYQNGLLEYNGEKFVEKTGSASFTLSKEELANLRQEVSKTNLWQYPDEVESRIMDAPYATLSAWSGEKVKSVRGSIDRPKPLLELEKMIKNIAEAHGLKVIKGVNPNVSSAATSELLVKLKPEVNAGNWLLPFEELKLRLIRRVYDNTWLVGFDPAQIEESQIIEMLKKTEGVLDVQANQTVKDRN